MLGFVAVFHSASPKLEGFAKRVLDAEGERDTARDQLRALERTLDAERTEHGGIVRGLEPQMSPVGLTLEGCNWQWPGGSRAG
jgi:hypothetical protein